MYQIEYDESGTLRSKVFYLFYDVQLEDKEPYTSADYNDDWIVGTRDPTSDKLFLESDKSWLWVEVITSKNTREIERKCHSYKLHITQAHNHPESVEANGGPLVSPLVPDAGMLFVVMSGDLAKAIRETKLVGYDLKPLRITLNQSDCKKVPDLFYISFQGANCLRPRIVTNAKNACPFCGTGPVVCPKCGFEVIKCTECGEFVRVASAQHKGVGDKRLTMAPIPRKGQILDGSKWDGSDFIQCKGLTFVTKRVVDWLTSIHAAPFAAQPARVATNGMSREQLARLEEATHL